MIEKLNRPLKLGELTSFLIENYDLDFYFTQDNVRYYITDQNSVKKFLSQTPLIFYKKEKDLYVGLIGIWKSCGGGIIRYYIKLIAKDFKMAKDLITVLLWNCNKDLYVKISKNNKFVSAFKSKGFKFSGGRGSQILLYRKYINIQNDNTHNTHNTNTLSN